MRILFILIFLCLISFNSFSQGSLMLAGGGGEVAAGWSDIPYRWVVDRAQNKRIAIITYDNAATDWIPNYFRSFGAKAAKNFILNSRNVADQQLTYDSLITYTGVFIKGGDQAKYYEYYKGTKTQAAIQLIYNRGGVISGTSAGAAIISPIVFTAQVASVDPAAALLEAYSPQITLADDFLKSLKGKYIFDTHFAERGRLGRLTAFLASWYKKTGDLATGFGIDDHTAICIEKDGKATVYGTGTVSIVKNLNTTKPFNTSSPILDCKDMSLSQIPHGCSIDMNTAIGSGLKDLIKPLFQKEELKGKLICTGTEYPSDDAYDYFVNQTGKASDPIVIVTGSNLTRAADVKNKLTDKGASIISIVQAISGNENDANFQEKLNKAVKIFVVANDYSVFMSFVRSSGNGTVLLNKLKSKSTISLFAGDNARFAGKTVVNKYAGFGYASYDGKLEFLPGLSLLKTTAIMPNSFFSAETYENTTTGLPFAMIKDTLRFGIYLTGSACAEYNYTTDGQLYLKNLSGYFPVIVLENSGTKAGFVNQGPGAVSRNIAAFESMKLSYLGVGDQITLLQSTFNEALKNELQLKIYPNPATRQVLFEGQANWYKADIFNYSGILINSLNFWNAIRVDLDGFTSGMYLVKITEKDSQLQTSYKLLVN